MEKERTSKIIAVVALVIGVVALSIGFAAYSRDMNITDLDGEINPGEMELDVLFDNDTTADNALANVFGQGVAAVEGEDGAEIDNPELNKGLSPTISGFHAKFTAKGQKVTYTFYVHNNSPYNAYLSSASFANSQAKYKICEAIDPDTTNDDYVQNACEDITLSLKVDNVAILSTGEYTFSSHTIGPNEWKEVVVEIAYDGDDYPLPDGDMTVVFDGIKLKYTSISQ